MRRFLICAVLLAAVGTFLIGTNCVLAEEGAAKEGDSNAVVAKAIESLEAAIKHLETSPDDFGGQKQAALDDSKKAVEQLKKVEKPGKKAGCSRPGSMMLSGVGC